MDSFYFSEKFYDKQKCIRADTSNASFLISQEIQHFTLDLMNQRDWEISLYWLQVVVIVYYYIDTYPPTVSFKSMWVANTLQNRNSELETCEHISKKKNPNSLQVGNGGKGSIGRHNRRKKV